MPKHKINELENMRFIKEAEKGDEEIIKGKFVALAQLKEKYLL